MTDPPPDLDPRHLDRHRAIVRVVADGGLRPDEARELARLLLAAVVRRKRAKRRRRRR